MNGASCRLAIEPISGSCDWSGTYIIIMAAGDMMGMVGEHEDAMNLVGTNGGLCVVHDLF